MTTGSEKQIKWADDIKGYTISGLHGWLSQPDMVNCKNRLMAVINGLNEIVDSKTIIDHRDLSNKDIVRWIEGLSA